MTPQTRLIILNSPANPTGGVTPRDEIDKLVAGPRALARRRDPVRRDLRADDLRQPRHQTLLAYPEIRDRLILLDGWSKTYAMTGWRLGFSVWPQPLYDAARKLAVNSYSCVNSAAQFAGLAALTGPQDAVARDGRRIRRAPPHRRRRAERAAGRARRDAEGRLLRVPQHFRRPAGRRRRSPARCSRKRAWRRSAGPISASPARVTSASPTPIRARTSCAPWSGSTASCAGARRRVERRQRLDPSAAS